MHSCDLVNIVKYVEIKKKGTVMKIYKCISTSRLSKIIQIMLTHKVGSNFVFQTQLIMSSKFWPEDRGQYCPAKCFCFFGLLFITFITFINSTTDRKQSQRSK